MSDSANSGSVEYRRCRCGRQISVSEYDPHSLCLDCRGKACELGDTCHECGSMDEASFRKFLDALMDHLPYK